MAAAAVAPARDRYLDPPSWTVFAASSNIDVLDTEKGAVVGSITVKRSINGLVFSPDGQSAFAATSEGVFRIDTRSLRTVATLTELPAHKVSIDRDGRALTVLERPPPGSPDVSFRMTTVDLATGLKNRSEIVGRWTGEAIAAVVPAPFSGAYHLVVTLAGEARIGKGPGHSGDFGIDPEAEIPSSTTPYATEHVAAIATKAFVAVDGSPSRILAIDLETGSFRTIDLETDAFVRGLALSAGGKRLLVGSSDELIAIDVDQGAIIGRLSIGPGHLGVALSDDGAVAFAAQTVGVDGGAVTVVDVDALLIRKTIHLDHMDPRLVAVRPQAN